MESMTDAASTVRLNLQTRLADTQALLDSACLEQVVTLTEKLTSALRAGNKVIFFGNGGSSMDAGHLAAEFLGRFYFERPSLPAVSLSDSTAAMTAIGNDYDYSETFSRQLRALARPGDVAVGLTTSGNSGNVVAALQAARELGVFAAALTGAAGGRARDVADICIQMPTNSTPRVQEMCMHLGHTMCEIVERDLFPEGVRA